MVWKTGKHSCRCNETTTTSLAIKRALVHDVPCARQDWSSAATHDTCLLLLKTRSCTSTASTATLRQLLRCSPRSCAASSNFKTTTEDQVYPQIHSFATDFTSSNNERSAVAETNAQSLMQSCSVASRRRQDFLWEGALSS